MPEDEFVMVKLENGDHVRLPVDHPGVTAQGVTRLKRDATRPNGDPEPNKVATDLSKSSATSAASSTTSNTAEKKDA